VTERIRSLGRHTLVVARRVAQGLTDPLLRRYLAEL
jgi:hypothetical protein